MKQINELRNWEERNGTLVKEMEEYCDKYRKKHCGQCSSLDDNCGIRTYPSGKIYCDKMITARLKMFKPRIEKEIEVLMDSQDIV